MHSAPAAGLIISEATGISPEGLGTPFAPGIWNDEQVEGWKPVVERVHQAGGPASSASSGTWGGWCIPISTAASPRSRPRRRGSTITHIPMRGTKPYETARALEIGEIPPHSRRLCPRHRKCEARRFRWRADPRRQWLSDRTSSCAPRPICATMNMAARSRTASACWARWRSTWSACGAMTMSRSACRPMARDAGGERCDAGGHLHSSRGAARQDRHRVFWSCASRRWTARSAPATCPPVSPHIRKVFSGPLVLNSDYDHDKAVAGDGPAAFPMRSVSGRTFLANPDLPARLAVKRTAYPGQSRALVWRHTRGLYRLPDHGRAGGQSRESRQKPPPRHDCQRPAPG
jgi:N-ethylmaleimide reductase